MIQHVRRKPANALPATTEASIPAFSLLYTTVESVLQLRLRFSTALMAGVTVTSLVRPESLSAQTLLTLSVALCTDRSGIVYLKVRRLR
ncbi:hypothetical protein ACIQHY_12690 [Streptomyces sp. NPDC092359]|uniref:hypothetical protein n=1 Tax=Streptomyces sp. NPDC092359 TaxID=3366014 RepID=UPI003817E7E5